MHLSELKKEPHLSASSANDYIDCGLLYKLGRIDRLPPEFKADALEFGTTIHLVLGEYYQEKLIGNRLSLKDLQESFEKHWRDLVEGRTDIQYSEGKDIESLLLEGKELLGAWYNKLPEDNFKVLAIEEAFRLILPGISIPVIGAIDLIEEDDSDTIVITDWKTSSRSYSADEIDQNMQLTIYQMAAKSNGYSDREILLRFDCLIKTKTPKFEQYWTTRDDIDERRVIRQLIQVWNGIQKGVWIPRNSWKCKNCAYRKACDEWFLGGDK